MPAKPAKFSCRQLLAICAVLSPTLAAVPTAHAVDRDWVGTGPVLFWDTGSNWNPAARPESGDNLTFAIDTGGSSIIAGASSDSAEVLFDGFDWSITGSDARIDSTGQVFVRNDADVMVSNSLLWQATDRISVGDGSDGTLTVLSQANVIGTSVRAGVDAGVTGTLNVGGDPGILTRLQTSGSTGADGFLLGDAGTGILNVLPGGEARIFNDTSGSIADFELGLQETGVGVLNIDGGLVFAEDLSTGSGSATINVTNGGFLNQAVHTSPDALLAIEPTGTASVRVAGVGSRWNMNRLEIAQNGTVTVLVEDGGTLTNETTDDIVIGRDLDSSGTLAIVGTPESAAGAGDARISTVNGGRDMIVGNVGRGELRVGIGLDADLSTHPVGPGHASLNMNGASRDLTLGLDAANPTTSVAYLTGPNTNVIVGDILFVGQTADAEMTVNGGAQVVSRRPRVASGADTTASLTVDGPGSRFDSTLDMTVGTSGNGTAVVSGGATLSTTDYLAVGFQGDSDSTLTVDGPGSLVRVATNNAGDLHVGGFTSSSGGTGTLTIQNGGRVEVSDEAYIGGNVTGDGTLIVTGAGSVYDHDEGNTGDNLHIGYRGAGVMQVLDGGLALTEETLIGEGTGSAPAELTVSGTGSTFRTNGRLTVGDVRKSSMTVSDGALVTVGANPNADDVNTRRLIIGNGGAADGSTLTVTGVGSRVDFFGGDRISVGFTGGSAAARATLEVLDGGVVDALQRDGSGQPTTTGFLMVADENGSSGLVTVDGVGSRVSARFMNVGDGPTNGNGLVHITDGGLLETTTQVEVGSNGNGVGVINIGGLDNQAQPFANVATLDVGTVLDIGSDDPTNGNASGTVNVLSNGHINADGVFVGRTTGAFGTLTVGGLNSDATAIVNVAGDLVVAGSATSSQQSGGGTFNLNANAVINVGNDFRVRDRGIVNINGGEITFESLQLNNTSVAGEPTINFSSGTVRYDNAGTVNFDVLNSQVLFGESGLGSSGVATLKAGQTFAVESSDPANGGEINFIVPLRINGGTLRVDAVLNNDFSDVDWDAGSLELLRANLTVGTAGLLGRTVALGAAQELHINQAVTVQANGTLSVTGDAAVQPGEQFTAGSLGNFGLAVFTSADLDVDADNAGNGLFNNGRLVLIDSDLTGPVVNEGSITLVGDSTLNAAAFENTAAATLELSLAPDQTLGPVINAAGTATLAGNLDLDTDNTNFALLPYQPLTLIEAADLTGTFAQVDGVDLNASEALAVTYEPAAVRVTRALRGDANLSGQVEQGDLNAVLNNWGSAGQSWATGDLSGDGVVNQADLNAVLNNWGSSTAPDFQGFAVPEPGAAVAVASLGILLRRRPSD